MILTPDYDDHIEDFDDTPLNKDSYVCMDIRYIEAALSTYGGSPAENDIREAWSRLKCLLEDRNGTVRVPIEPTEEMVDSVSNVWSPRFGNFWRPLVREIYMKMVETYVQKT